MSLFDSDLKKLMEFYGKEYKIDNTKSLRTFDDLSYVKLEKSIGELMISMENLNVIKYQKYGSDNIECD